MGIESRKLEVSEPVTVGQVWQQVTDQLPPENLLCARNLKYVDWDELVVSGDEIAFFPPVTGG